MTKLRIAVISDTHGQHHLLTIPEVDILLHTGDFTDGGTPKEVWDFFDWFRQQPAKHKIVIAGNHDYYMEQGEIAQVQSCIPSNVIYLNNEMVEVEGLRIWGSPIQPTFLNMAFNRNPGKEIQSYWDLIPNDIDILLTHGPAFGILDRTLTNKKAGCKELRKAIEEKKPRMHICGHIHEGYGNMWHKGMLFINASSMNHTTHTLSNTPILFEIGSKHLVAQPAYR